MSTEPELEARARRRRAEPTLWGRRLPLPDHWAARAVLGATLILGGLLGFLPVLGFWMVPLGLMVLAVDFPAADRLRRQGTAWTLRIWRRLRRRVSS